MKPVCRAFVISALALMLASPLATSAQWNKKPYTEWSEKDATRVLNESPWGKTHTFTDMSKSFSSGPGANPNARTTPSADASVRNVHFHIRFLSARPVREAFARSIALRQKGAIPEQAAARLKAFVVSGFNDFVALVLDCESESKTEFQQVQALFQNRTTADLKNTTYLQSGNNKIFLEEYQSPKSDGLGARLAFPRLVDGKPWLTEASDEIHSYCELSTTYKLDMRYKVKDMMYQGKLEY